MQVKKQQLEPDMEQQTGSKLRKEYVKAAYCHAAGILEPPKIKSVTVSIVFPSICNEVIGPDAMMLFSEC